MLFLSNNQPDITQNKNLNNNTDNGHKKVHKMFLCPQIMLTLCPSRLDIAARHQIFL